jgi:Ca2+-binding RTX toxin-like protein
MATFFTNLQYQGPFPANLSTIVSKENFTNYEIDGVTYPTAIRLTYKSADGGVWRASVGGSGLSITFNLSTLSFVYGGTVQGYLQERQTVPAITNPIPLPAVFGKAWGVKGISVSLRSVYNEIKAHDVAPLDALTATVFAGNDDITLSPFDDPAVAGQFVRGYGGADIMRGGAGHDRLRGDGGNDTLIGGLGNDTLFGVLGKDSLQGSEGADRFVYQNPAESPTGAGRDVIVDFDPLAGDRIALVDIDANPATAIDNKFVYLGSAPFTGSATQGQVRFTTSGGNGLLSINLAGGADPLAAEMEIELKGVTSLPALNPANPFLVL